MALRNIVGIDHAVVVVRDLDQAAANWQRLGFTVSPRGTHSAKMGTGNYTIMLDPDYIELLGVLVETEHNAPTRAMLAKRGFCLGELPRHRHVAVLLAGRRRHDQRRILEPGTVQLPHIPEHEPAGVAVAPLPPLPVTEISQVCPVVPVAVMPDT